MTSIRTRRLTMAGAALAALTVSMAAPAAAAPETIRLDGSDRYQTALTVSEVYDTSEVVFVASGETFPDALSASAAAAEFRAPLLLTRQGALPAGVADRIRELEPDTIYLVGGPATISDGVASALTSIAPTERLSGANRYETSLVVARTAFSTTDTAFIATGRSFPDALSASGAAGTKGAPVVLVDGAGSTVSDKALEQLTALGVKKIAIAGGEGSVSGGIAAQLAESSYEVARYGGANRYETARRINEAYFTTGTTFVAFLASGQGFPDALSGSALAGALQSPLIVTVPTCLSGPADATIKALEPATLIVLGGPASVSDKALNGGVCA